LLARSSRHTPFFLCQLDEAYVLYYPLTDRLMLLNATGKIVWDLLNRGLEKREIGSAFAQHFGISDEQAARDVAQLLDDLTDEDPNGERKEADASTAVQCATGTPELAWREKPASCGVFEFGRSSIKVFSSVADLDESFFQRFQHRAAGNRHVVDVLEISAATSDAAFRLTFCGRVIAEAATIHQTMWQLVQFLLSLEHPHKHSLAYCHAGAVSHMGRSLLMPGGSGVGKSTLTGFLAAHGFAYLGDDAIAIAEEDMSLLPLPTCLSIKGRFLADSGATLSSIACSYDNESLWPQYALCRSAGKL
jgi:hypothetical protein